MDRTRIERVLDAVASQPAGPLPTRLCTAAVVATSASGAGITVVTDDGHFHTVGATGTGVQAEELQLTLGEGPSHDAHRGGRSVTAEDLAGDPRWVVFRPDAVEAGIAAIFAFPLRSGAARFGAFTLYRDRRGPLDDEQVQDGFTFARLALDLIVGVQADQPLDDLHEMFSAGEAVSWEVHQATGMVAVQLDIPMNDALARLRAHAFASGTLLGAVARATVSRQLRWDEA